MLSDKEIEAYAAGIFDGEGCLFVHRNIWSSRKARRGNLEYNVTITQKKVEVLEWLHEHFGGGVGFQKSGGIHYWRVGGPRAYWFLKTIIKYSIVRKFDIKVMLNIWENRKDKELTDKLIDERKQNIQNRKLHRQKEESL